MAKWLDTHAGICEQTGKKGWDSWYLADEVLREAWRRRRPGKLPIRVYQCRFCSMYHLTSKPLRKERY